MSAFKPLIGSSNFAEIRQNQYTYVDKTGFLNTFLEPLKVKVALFTRPRRFGKTLFMSMLASFFDITKDSRELFSGLKVAANAKLCEQWMNRYPVVFLTFKDVDESDYELALSDIHALIRKICNQHKYLLTSEKVEDDDKEDIRLLLGSEIDKGTLGRSLQVLTRALSCHYDMNPIVLIDEYDVPVANAHTNVFCDKMIKFERNFLSRALKDNIHIKFAILTGCLRVTKESIFTGLNNLKCFDIINDSYSDSFGFTQAEVDKLLTDANCEENRDVVREWYDGYSFGEHSDIYCPWSIMNYLDDVQERGLQAKPHAYWVNTSANELPKDIITQLSNATKARGAIASLLAGIPIKVSLNPEMNYVDVLKNPNNFWTLLYLTGYLTRVARPEVCVDGNLDDDGVKNQLGDGTKKNTGFLAIPNREVHEVFNTLFRTWLEDLLSGDTNKLRKDLYDALWKGDTAEIEKAVSAVLVGCNVFDHKESYYHGVLYTLLWLGYSGTTSNGQAGVGFYDVIVPNQEEMRAAVLELKRVPSDTSSQTLEQTMEKYVGEALKQIASRRYDEDLREEGYARILHVGIAFHGRKVKAGVKTVSNGDDTGSLEC